MKLNKSTLNTLALATIFTLLIIGAIVVSDNGIYGRLALWNTTDELVASNITATSTGINSQVPLYEKGSRVCTAGNGICNLEDDLQQYYTNCKTYTNITIDNVTGLCENSTERPSFAIYQNNTNTWDYLCCEYTSPDCILQSTNDTNQICQFTLNQETKYLYQRNGIWVARCCAQGIASEYCYTDTRINIAENTTICDVVNNTRTPISITYNMNASMTWDSVCCLY